MERSYGVTVQGVVLMSTFFHSAYCAQDGSVMINCSTQQPYRHCLEVPSSGEAVEVTVQGICFEHYSKSVANNYCIFAQVCKLLP
jgi:hypothetical protein